MHPNPSVRAVEKLTHSTAWGFTDLDLVSIVSYNEHITVCFNDGSGNFAADPDQTFSILSAQGLAAGDLDGDGGARTHAFIWLRGTWISHRSHIHLTSISRGSPRHMDLTSSTNGVPVSTSRAHSQALCHARAQTLISSAAQEGPAMRFGSTMAPAASQVAQATGSAR